MICANLECVFSEDGIAGAEVPIFGLPDPAAYLGHGPYRGVLGVKGSGDESEAGVVSPLVPMVGLGGECMRRSRRSRPTLMIGPAYQ